MQIGQVQEQLGSSDLDGWLFYDFQGLNPIARKLVGLEGNLLTRRWFYWIPKTGAATVLCHRIEQQAFQRLEGQLRLFKSWNEMIEGLEATLAGANTIAMEYSPNCAIPYVSRVDAGTLDLVRGLGKRVVSSADLVQYFEATWSHEQFLMHQQASQSLMQVFFETLAMVKNSLSAGDRLREFDVQRFMLEQYQRRGLVSFSPPIVAVNQNSGNPHYEPTPEKSAPINPGDFLLIDFWAKLQKMHAVYADYTWVAYLGESIPETFTRIWGIVKGARDAAAEYVKANYPKKVPIQGWQVDSVAREFVRQRGYAEFFIHRTGHSIGEEDHGNGANMDGLETKDERRLISHTCFSIEPGIYLPEFGIRSEINVYLEGDGVVITGDPVQQEIVRLH